MSKDQVDDVVNHPAHYTDGKFETIEAIESWRLGYHLGNAVKYISRAGKKSKDTELEDLRKARWYIKRRIDHLNPEVEVIGPVDYAADKGLDQDLSSAVLYLVASELPPFEPRDTMYKALAALERAIGVREARAND